MSQLVTPLTSPSTHESEPGLENGLEIVRRRVYFILQITTLLLCQKHDAT